MCASGPAEAVRAAARRGRGTRSADARDREGEASRSGCRGPGSGATPGASRGPGLPPRARSRATAWARWSSSDGRVGARRHPDGPRRLVDGGHWKSSPASRPTTPRWRSPSPARSWRGAASSARRRSRPTAPGSARRPSTWAGPWARRCAAARTPRARPTARSCARARSGSTPTRSRRALAAELARQDSAYPPASRLRRRGGRLRRGGRARDPRRRRAGGGVRAAAAWARAPAPRRLVREALEAARRGRPGVRRRDPRAG